MIMVMREHKRRLIASEHMTKAFPFFRDSRPKTDRQQNMIISSPEKEKRCNNMRKRYTHKHAE